MLVLAQTVTPRCNYGGYSQHQYSSPAKAHPGSFRKVCTCHSKWLLYYMHSTWDVQQWKWDAEKNVNGTVFLVFFSLPTIFFFHIIHPCCLQYENTADIGNLYGTINKGKLHPIFNPLFLQALTMKYFFKKNWEHTSWAFPSSLIFLFPKLLSTTTYLLKHTFCL